MNTAWTVLHIVSGSLGGIVFGISLFTKAFDSRPDESLTKVVATTVMYGVIFGCSVWSVGYLILTAVTAIAG